MDPYNYDSFGQCEIGAPDFALTNLDGKKISLGDFKGKKHVILEFGSIT